jgi:hypothetical protein
MADPQSMSYPYLWLDAKAERVREPGGVRSKALVVAYARTRRRVAGEPPLPLGGVAYAPQRDHGTGAARGHSDSRRIDAKGDRPGPRLNCSPTIRIYTTSGDLTPASAEGELLRCQTTGDTHPSAGTRDGGIPCPESCAESDRFRSGRLGDSVASRRSRWSA